MEIHNNNNKIIIFLYFSSTHLKSVLLLCKTHFLFFGIFFGLALTFLFFLFSGYLKILQSKNKKSCENGEGKINDLVEMFGIRFLQSHKF